MKVYKIIPTSVIHSTNLTKILKELDNRKTYGHTSNIKIKFRPFAYANFHATNEGSRN